MAAGRCSASVVMLYTREHAGGVPGVAAELVCSELCELRRCRSNDHHQARTRRRCDRPQSTGVRPGQHRQHGERSGREEEPAA